MNRKGAMDLTQGRPIKQILLFSMPLVLATLYCTVLVVYYLRKRLRGEYAVTV